MIWCGSIQVELCEQPSQLMEGKPGVENVILNHVVL
jgi:hypothetical protein